MFKRTFPIPYHTLGDDNFDDRNYQGTLGGSNFSNEVPGFDRVDAIAGAGNDLFDVKNLTRIFHKIGVPEN